ncbi:MAG TPA: glycosyltransferase family 2 protein [Candidatus Paceibacterota bacterium]
MKDLSIIIVHHQTPELLKLCLDSLTKTTSEIDREIIVIDSTISHKARDIIKSNFSGVVYLPFKGNLGYSRGVNEGVKHSKGQYILVVNPDVIVTEGSIGKMLQYIQEHEDIGMLGPQILNFNGTHQRTFFSYYKPSTVLARRTFLGRLKRFKKEINNFLMTDADYTQIQTPDWIMGSAMMISRRALEKVGGMDERFFMYFEDVDWARRFWHNDYKVVYYPEAVFYHYHQRESKSKLGILDAIFNRKTRWHIQSAFKFFWKYHDLRKVKI